METLAQIIGIASGFALMRIHEPAVRMIATSLVIDATLAPLTAIIASRRRRSAGLWAVLGFIFGVWALAYVLLFHRRTDRANPDYPPTSDAA